MKRHRYDGEQPSTTGPVPVELCTDDTRRERCSDALFCDECGYEIDFEAGDRVSWERVGTCRYCEDLI